MPLDLFIGKSNVQTNVYVFRVGEAHQKDDIVKFIDFSNDGYKRTKPLVLKVSVSMASDNNGNNNDTDTESSNTAENDTFIFNVR